MVRRLPAFGRGPEIGQVFLGQGNGLAFVRREEINHAIGFVDIRWADLLRREGFTQGGGDQGRSRHADIGLGRGDQHIAHAGQIGIAGETAPRDDAHQGRLARKPGKRHEGGQIQT